MADLYGGIKAHPLADAFPLLEGKDFEELKDDISRHGVHHPITMHEGMILDGRNRKRACQALDLPCREVRFTGDDPAAFVVSENLRRRHMTPAERAIAAEKLATAMVGRPRKTQPDEGDTKRDTTIRQAADLMQVGESSVQRVRTVRRRGTKRVQQAMDAGELSPTAADYLSRRPADEQAEVMDTIPVEDIPSLVNPPRVPPPIRPSFSDAPAKAKGPGRGYVGPKVTMQRQMDLPDLRVIQGVAEDWEEHKGLIKDLDPERLVEFVKELKRSRVATGRVIKLIEESTAK